MSFYAKVGSFTADTTKTAGQTQQISGLGFTPSVVLFWWSGCTGTSDVVESATAFFGFGAAVSSSSRWCNGIQTANGGASSRTQRYIFTSDCIRIYTLAPTLDGIFDLQSMDAGGFTLAVDDQFATAFRIHYLALGGTDITNVALGTKAMPVSTGNYSVTGLPFQPEMVIASYGHIDTLETWNDMADQSIGWATASGAGNMGTVLLYTENARNPTVTRGYGFDNEVVDGGMNYRDQFVQFTSDGFTFNHLEGAVANQWAYVAIRGGKYKVGEITTRTDGNDITVSSLGFSPYAVMFMSAQRAHSTQDNVSNNASISFGGASSLTDRACVALFDTENVNPPSVQRGKYETEVYLNIQSGVMAGLMDIKALGSDGFTCVMDDTDPSGCWVSYLAIGISAITLTVNDASCTSQVDTSSVTDITQYTIVRPSADVTDGNWKNELGNNTNLYESVNEASAGDSDYIKSDGDPSNSPVVLKLASATDPQNHIGHILRIRYGKEPSSGGTIDLTVELRQSYVSEADKGTLIASWTRSGIGGSLGTFDLYLSEAEAATISNYGSLYVRISANKV